MPSIGLFLFCRINGWRRCPFARAFARRANSPWAPPAGPCTCCARHYPLGCRLCAHLRARTTDRIGADHRQWIFVGGAGALLGARLLGLLEHPDLLTPPPGGRLHYFINETIAGARTSSRRVSLLC